VEYIPHTKGLIMKVNWEGLWMCPVCLDITDPNTWLERDAACPIIGHVLCCECPTCGTLYDILTDQIITEGKINDCKLTDASVN
jgi:hypothetical protein